MERKVYLLLTDTGTLFTRMIKLYTNKPYNHASISFDSQLAEVYSFGRKSPRNPFIGGFVKENIQDGLLKHSNCAIYCCTLTEYQYQKMKNFIQSIEEQKHCYRYNLLGLFAIILNKKLKRENAFFCSEFVATVLNKGENFHFSKPLSLVTPHDLQQSSNFQKIYQGSLKDFSKENEVQRNIRAVTSQLIASGF
ncbi:hypothetical protein ACFSO7_11425 [Bacillus sp. CGMCC 1.16607]|uniref:hypothetical protein n=1 Tax=Bacillus sp. CGMCC 1.16607 TaxID=3351842 RepID=UPI00363C1810